MGLTAQELGLRIAKAREQRNMSQRDLDAALKNIGGETGVAQYENGRNYPRLLNLLKIADVLNVPMAYFFGDGYDQRPQDQAILAGVAQLLQGFLGLNSSLVRERDGQDATGGNAIPVDERALDRLAEEISNRLGKDFRELNITLQRLIEKLPNLPNARRRRRREDPPSPKS